MTASFVLHCDPCKETKEFREGFAFCVECRDVYCKDCTENHRKLTIEKEHNYVKLQGTEESHFCDICSRGYAIQVAHSFCRECRELYCETCSGYHKQYEQTSDHHLINLKLGFLCETNDCNSERPNSVVISENSHLEEKTSEYQLHNLQAILSDRDTSTAKCEHDGESVESRLDNEIDAENRRQTKEGVLQDKDNEANGKREVGPCFQVKFISEFSVKSDKDVKPCNVNRIVMMPNGNILVIDNANYKMKLFSDDCMLMLEKSIPPLCSAVNYIDETTIVLTLRGSIRLYNIGKTAISETQKEMRINGGICDILHTKGKFVICFQKGSDACISSLNMNGSMHILRKEKNRILNLYDFLQFDEKNNLIFQSNFDKGSLTCLDDCGGTKWTVFINGGPTGLAIGRDCLFVAVYGKERIQQYSVGGNLINSLLLTTNECILCPYALGFRVSANMLYVSKNYQSKVSVFSLLEIEQNRN